MTPDEFTINEHFVDVGDGHQLYAQDWGNSKAKTAIILLHGGPGSGSKDRYKAMFDPSKQRVIFFDQRGCGRSLPFGSLEHNNTQQLMADISKVIDHVGVGDFVITGGSWGSCLALAYALTKPAKLKALVLHGIFTGSQKEIDWLDKGHMQAFFPDTWERFLEATPKSHRSNPSVYHFNRVMGQDEAAAKESGFIYENLEGGVMSLDDRYTPEDINDFDHSGIRTEMYYLHHRCFLPDNYILNNAHKISVPVWLVQGRYDAVCPPITAWKLHKALPESQLIWTISGHKPERESWNVLRTILLQWG